MIGGGGSLRPAREAISPPPQAVEQLRKAGPERMAEARARAFDHQRLRIAVERGDDHLLHRMEYLLVLIDDLLEPRGERADDAIGEEHAEEGPDQRRPDHSAQH